LLACLCTSNAAALAQSSLTVSLSVLVHSSMFNVCQFEDASPASDMQPAWYICLLNASHKRSCAFHAVLLYRLKQQLSPHTHVTVTCGIRLPIQVFDTCSTAMHTWLTSKDAHHVQLPTSCYSTIHNIWFQASYTFHMHTS
jgi:hypothetical protein